MSLQGKVTTWKDDRGFGFITPTGGGEPVFLHVSSLTNRQRRPQRDELVSYELATDAKGRRQAKAVTFVGERAVAPAAPRAQRPAPGVRGGIPRPPGGDGVARTAAASHFSPRGRAAICLRSPARSATGA
ncbi:cold-shock protein [Thauera sp. ZXT1-4]|uniref:cold-shock protein n=1 Tax=Thauera sp. ZXT1-4 TaxID=3460294 RepID=UPI0040406F1D